MNLLIRLNVVFVIAFAVAGVVAYEFCASLQQADARREALTHGWAHARQRAREPRLHGR